MRRCLVIRVGRLCKPRAKFGFILTEMGGAVRSQGRISHLKDHSGCTLKNKQEGRKISEEAACSPGKA